MRGSDFGVGFISGIGVTLAFAVYAQLPLPEGTVCREGEAIGVCSREWFVALATVVTACAALAALAEWRRSTREKRDAFQRAKITIGGELRSLERRGHSFLRTDRDNPLEMDTATPNHRLLKAIECVRDIRERIENEELYPVFQRDPGSLSLQRRIIVKRANSVLRQLSGPDSGLSSQGWLTANEIGDIEQFMGLTRAFVDDLERMRF